MLRGAKHAFRMRHEQGHAAIRRRDAGDALRRAIRVLRIVFGRSTSLSTKRSDSSRWSAQSQMRGIREFCVAFTMRHGDRHARTLHAREEQ